MRQTILSALPLMALSGGLLPAVLIQAPPSLAQTASLSAMASDGETLYLAPDTVFPYNLKLATATTVNGRSLPAGATIRGQFEPVSGGLRYVASGVEVDNRIYTLQATSNVLHDIKDPRETSAEAVLGDAAIGAAGGAVLGGILGGGVSVGEVIGGAAAGTIIGNVSAQRVVVVQPNQTIQLTTR